MIVSLQAGAAAALLLSPCDALANEFDIMNEPRPTTNYVIDDAGVLNKTTRKSINDQLSRLEVRAWPRLPTRIQRSSESVVWTASMAACELGLGGTAKVQKPVTKGCRLGM